MIVIVISISEKIDSCSEKKRKLKIIQHFKNLKSYEYTRMDDAIFDRYKLNNGSYLKNISYLINDENALNKNYNKITERLKSKEFRRFRREDEFDDFNLIGVDPWTLINEMISDGFIIKENEKLRINQAMRDSLRKFITFLNDKKEFKDDLRNGDTNLLNFSEPNAG